MKKLSLILVIVLLASTALIAFENHGRGTKGHDMGEMRNRMADHHKNGMRDGKGNNEFGDKNENTIFSMAEELELSDAIKDEMMVIRNDNRKANIKIRADIDVMKIEKNEAMRDHKFKEVKKINANISDENLKIRNSRVELRESLWNKLTKEQQEKAEELMKEHHRKGSRRRSSRGYK